MATGSGRPKHGWTKGNKNKRRYKKFKLFRKNRMKKQS